MTERERRRMIHSLDTAIAVLSDNKDLQADLRVIARMVADLLTEPESLLGIEPDMAAIAKLHGKIIKWRVPDDTPDDRFGNIRPGNKVLMRKGDYQFEGVALERGIAGQEIRVLCTL